MKISVVIPARNSARTVGATIEALLAGERQPDEIIVVDGCSIDDTVAVAERHGARVVMNNKKHAAAGEAGRNIERAS